MRTLRSVALALIALMAAPPVGAAEMTFLGWSHTEVALKPPLERLFQSFQAANPSDKVEIVGFPFGQMEQNLVLRLRAGQRTDVAQLQERWVPQFAAANALADLGTVFGKDWLAERIDPAILALGQVKGVQVGMPFTIGAITMVANRRILAEAGITTLPVTWDEHVAAFRKIKVAKPDVIPFGFSTKLAPNIQIESMILFWSHGARFFDDKGKVLIDSPEARVALKRLVDMVNDGLVAKGNDRFDTRKLFAIDKVAFFFDPPAVRGFIRSHSGKGAEADANVMALPVPVIRSGEPPRGVLWAHHLVMFTTGGAKPTRDSLPGRFVQAMLFDKAAQLALWDAAGQIPSTRAALADVGDDPFAQAFIEASRTALWDETSFWPNGAELRQIIAEEVEAAMLAGKAVDDAIASMARRLDRALADAR